MKKDITVSVLLGSLMIGAALITQSLTPTVKVATGKHVLDIRRIIPVSFNGWDVDDTSFAIMVNPVVQKQIDRIYNQTISRTYINGAGQRVMLAVAYGGDQSDSMAVHKPEVCYPAQGFQIVKSFADTVQTVGGFIPSTRLVARQNQRIESVTYWIRVGDAVDGTGFQRKLTQLKYGLTGKVPDGLLFRVSTIGDEKQGFEIQKKFLVDMLTSMPQLEREFLIGRQLRSTPLIHVGML